jgi:hypothetical protein
LRPRLRHTLGGIHARTFSFSRTTRTYPNQQDSRHNPLPRISLVDAAHDTQTGQRNDPDSRDTRLYLIDKIESDATNALPNLTQESTMNAKKNAVAAVLNINMLGASEAAPMDPELAALLDVLGEPNMGAAPVESFEASVAALVESSEEVLLDAGTVEVLDVPPLLEVTAEPALSSEEAHGEALEAALANIEVQEAYALVPADAPAHEGVSDEEAEKERLLAEEALATEMSAAEPTAAAKKVRTPRTHYQNKTDRIKARLGSSLGDYLVLEIADAELEGDALKAKQDETLAVIDAMSVKVKNRASLLMDWLSGKTNKPNEIFKRALDVLAADGKIQTGDNGNLHKNLLSKPYSPSAARAMGRNTVTVMEKTKMIVQTGKGEFAPNPNSLFLMMAQQAMNPASEPLPEEPGAEEEPQVEEPNVEEPVVEELTAAE